MPSRGEPPPAPSADAPADAPVSRTPQHPERWRRERRGRTTVIGPLYRSGYLDVVVAGKLEDGRDFALAAGTHARHFPYFHPRSKWDDLLLVVGEDRLLTVGRHVSALSLTLTRGRGTFAYHGNVTRRTGALVEADIHLEFEATTYSPRAQGLGVRYTLLGLHWHPAFVRGSGSVTLHGRRMRVAELHGAMERGSLTSLRGRAFHFGYEYTAIVSPREPAVYVQFEAFPLAGGLSSLPLLLGFRANPVGESLTLGGAKPRSGDPLGLARRTPEPEETLVEHSIDVGPAHMRRQLLRIGAADGARFALRQTTEPDAR